MTSEIAKRLKVKDNGRARSLAMRIVPGHEPAIVWLGGFRSDLTSTKAQALADWGLANGRKVLRFDYSGHGASEGRFEDGDISCWLEDALAAIEAEAGTGPVFVGSSMGGWISLLAARRLKAAGAAGFPSAMVLIAPAVDFTEALIYQQMPEDIRAEMMEKGQWMRPSAYGPPYPITRRLIEDGRKHLLLGQPFEVGCPIHILQGLEDPDVPPAHAYLLMEHLPKDRVTLTTIADGDHRLSRPEDIAVLLRIVAGLAD